MKIDQTNYWNKTVYFPRIERNIFIPFHIISPRQFQNRTHRISNTVTLLAESGVLPVEKPFELEEATKENRVNFRACSDKSMIDRRRPVWQRMIHHPQGRSICRLCAEERLRPGERTFTPMAVVKCWHLYDWRVAGFFYIVCIFSLLLRVCFQYFRMINRIGCTKLFVFDMDRLCAYVKLNSL